MWVMASGRRCGQYLQRARWRGLFGGADGRGGGGEGRVGKSFGSRKERFRKAGGQGQV